MGYKTDCPECGRNNYWVTPENGKQYCFNCGHYQHEGTFDPPQRYENVKAIRAWYDKVTDWYQKDLPDTVKNYLHSRGLTEEEIVTYRLGWAHPHRLLGIRSIPEVIAAGLVTTTKDFHENRIIIPYTYQGHVTDMRSRAFYSSDDIKYKSCFGSSYYRGADYAFNHDALQHEGIVVVCESEFKAVFSNRAFPSIGLAGMSNFRIGIQFRTNQIPVICFDSQAKNYEDVYQAIIRFAKKVKHPKLRVAMLPMRGKDKQEIDGYINEYGLSEYRNVIHNSLSFEQWRKLIV